MSSLKFVLDVGLEFVPVVGKALDAGLGKSILLCSCYSVILSTTHLVRLFAYFST